MPEKEPSVVELQARWDVIRIANLYDTLDKMGYTDQCLDLGIRPLFPRQHLEQQRIARIAGTDAGKVGAGYQELKPAGRPLRRLSGRRGQTQQPTQFVAVGHSVGQDRAPAWVGGFRGRGDRIEPRTESCHNRRIVPQLLRI